jgi:hypothetical protein
MTKTEDVYIQADAKRKAHAAWWEQLCEKAANSAPAKDFIYLYLFLGSDSKWYATYSREIPAPNGCEKAFERVDVFIGDNPKSNHVKRSAPVKKHVGLKKQVEQAMSSGGSTPTKKGR